MVPSSGMLEPPAAGRHGKDPQVRAWPCNTLRLDVWPPACKKIDFHCFKSPGLPTLWIAAPGDQFVLFNHEKIPNKHGPETCWTLASALKTAQDRTIRERWRSCRSPRCLRDDEMPRGVLDGALGQKGHLGQNGYMRTTPEVD